MGLPKNWLKHGNYPIADQYDDDDDNDYDDYNKKHVKCEMQTNMNDVNDSKNCSEKIQKFTNTAISYSS